MGCASRLSSLSLSRGLLVASLAGCAVFLAAGVALLAGAGGLVDLIERDSLAVVPGTPMFPNWVDLPVPILTSIYLFNVTNAGEVVHDGAKPKLEEVGPFVYHELHHKTKLRWNDVNGTVTYQQVRTYHYQPHLSAGSLDDQVVTLNAVAATANAMALGMSKAARWTMGAAMVVMQEKLFVKKTVREVLFDGYSDPLLSDTKWILPGMPDKFGYYYQRNGSDYFDGVFNMHTGKLDLHKLGQVASWNYTSQLPFYPGKCGEVRGAGDFFSPGQKKDYVELFSNDLCRTLTMDFDSTTSSHNIAVNKYLVKERLFANSTENPENRCFEGESPVPSGVFDATPCRQGAPVFISLPHFYQADRYYTDQLEPGSVSPDKSKHETVFLVEPSSGLPVEVAARFQVNFRVKNIGNMQLFKFLREDLFVPAVWFESKISLSSGMLAEIWLLSNLTAILAGAGCVLLLLAAVLAALVGVHCRNKKAAAAGLAVSAGSQSEATGTQSLVTDDDGEEEEPAPLMGQNQG